MKKLISCLIFTVIAYSVFCQTSGQSGIIRELSGEVEFKREGSSAFVRASAGDVIALNTLISTGFRSTAIIEVGSSRITVRPLTRLSLAEIQRIENTETVNVNLQSGRVRVDVNPPAGSRTSFSVQSPSSTASVRGTSFDFDTVDISVDKGRVIFLGNAGPAVIVDAGNASFIGSDTTSADPVDVITAMLLPASPVGSSSEVIPFSSSSSNLLDFGIQLKF